MVLVSDNSNCISDSIIEEIVLVRLLFSNLFNHILTNSNNNRKINLYFLGSALINLYPINSFLINFPSLSYVEKYFSL